jgi:transmembrane sensor
MKRHFDNAPESPDSPADQAIAWFARLRADTVTEKEHAQFQSWLQESSAHAEAYRQIDGFWNRPELNRVLGEMPLSSRRSRPAIFQLSVGMALAAGIALAAVLYQPALIDCVRSDYCTGVGEIRTLQLADGSRVTLNSSSALAIAFEQNVRQVRLVRGEAYFEVRPDPSRPFQVEGRYSMTRVVGTRFTVREQDRSDTVTVISGLVEVAQDGRKSPLLKANERIRVAAGQMGGVQTVSGEAAAWVKGRLLFDNAPLEEVIAELGRYRRGAVVIRSERLKKLKVSGRFDVGDTDIALESLEQTLPIRLYRLTPWLVVIS